MIQKDEKKFLEAVKTILLFSPTAGVKLYMFKIYGDEQESHHWYVETHNKDVYAKEFLHHEIDEAIKYWWTPLRGSYLKE